MIAAHRPNCFRWSSLYRLCGTLAVAVLLMPQAARAIHFGEPMPADEHPAVGLVMVETASGQNYIGTGTLLAPDLVLTAAHVIQEAATPYHIRFKSDAYPDIAVPVLAYRIHPGYYTRPPTEDWPRIADSHNPNDVALLRLMYRYPKDVQYFRVAAESPRRGQQARLVGFGQDETGATGTRKSGRLQFLRERNDFFVFVATTEKYQRQGPGDSGGPLFIERDDGNCDIVGIVTGRDGFLGKERGLAADEYAYFVSMKAQADWIGRRSEELQAIQRPGGSSFYYLVRPQPSPPQPSVSLQTVNTLFAADIPPARAGNIIIGRGLCDPIAAEIVPKWIAAGFPEGRFFPIKIEDSGGK